MIIARYAGEGARHPTGSPGLLIPGADLEIFSRYRRILGPAFIVYFLPVAGGYQPPVHFRFQTSKDLRFYNLRSFLCIYCLELISTTVLLCLMSNFSSMSFIFRFISLCKFKYSSVDFSVM